ncbi:hypothetical protein EWM64_g7580 [Hericium alpestre]|uniref:Uncharacterized protein n=1 Tax=Hericium alpestre TaxID=135208 RepID=A0A4Y9ZQX7_9AGAM|nr:hypothetical protein EWM64_g7580 [Hericium alpestre]
MGPRSSLESNTDSIITTRNSKKATRQARSLSASEIARNVKNFDVWSTYQGCEQVEFSDMPDELRGHVDEVFKTMGMLPSAWVDKSSKTYRRMKSQSSPEFLEFLSMAHKQCPELFSDDVIVQASVELCDDMRSVFGAWKRLRRMRESQERLSEADYASNVYDVLRSMALSKCSYRSKCSISLPQPQLRPRSQALRVLNTKTVIPDGAVFIPAAAVRDLSRSAESPYKRLKRSSLAGRASNAERSFVNQSTPCVQLPSMPTFEFVSSFWEDKKPIHHMLEDAYRQNRMATAAALRHLDSLHVNVPVFGLVWSDGTVRAHVDWCIHDKKCDKDQRTIVRSAPFPGLDPVEEKDNKVFHEWRLDDPCEVIQVFLLIRNIDRWTMGTFRERIDDGIQHLVNSVFTERQKYRPWKRAGVLSVLTEQDENTSATMSAQQSSPEAKPKPKSKASRRHRRRS